MNSWKELLIEFPILQTILDIVSIVGPLSIFMAFAGIFFISSVAKILSITRRRAAFDKCSRQMALLGMIFGWLLLIGSRVWLYYTQDEHQAGTFINFMLETSWLLLSIGVLLSSIYYTLWRILKNMPVLHSTIGVISAVQNCMAFTAAVITIRLLAITPAQIDENTLLPDLFPTMWNDPLWTAVCISFPLIFALAAAFCAVWLTLRRKRDDFGRDYYNQMIPWLAAWAKNFWILLWIMLFVSASLETWQAYAQGSMDNQAIVDWGIQLLYWIIPFLLWTYVHAQKIAIRNKALLYLALLIAITYSLPYYLEISSITPNITNLNIGR